MNTILRHTIVVVLASLAVGVGLLLSSYMNAAPEEAYVEYKNSAYNYTVTYPSALKIQEYTPEIVSFAHLNGGFVDSVAEIRIMTIEGSLDESADAAIVRSLASLCAADGPTGSFSCTGTERSELVTTEAGMTGTKLYLRGELINFASTATTTISKGPYFVFTLGTSATMTRILAIHPPLNKSAEESDAPALEGIAKSLVVTLREEERYPDIETYVRQNIAELSREEAVLGGTFYVTEIEVKDGIGVVSYEDGHNAYTADFTYEVGEAGKLTTTSFIIREE